MSNAKNHWKIQRYTAVINLILGLWFVISLAHVVGIKGVRYLTVHDWVADTSTAFLIGVFWLAFVYHARLGLEVIIEDYVHTPGSIKFLMASVKFMQAFLSVAAVVALYSLVKRVSL